MATNWHYAKGGEKHGPITAAQLKELASTGQLHPDDLVWREDMKEWRKASTVKGLFSEHASASSPPPPPPPIKPNSTGELPIWERPVILVLSLRRFLRLDVTSTVTHPKCGTFRTEVSRPSSAKDSLSGT